MKPFILTTDAYEDLLVIQDYIAVDSPVNAANIVDDMFQTFEHLSQFPFTGHKREDLTGRDVRFFSVHSYLIIYDANTNPVSILRVLSGHRDIAAIL